RSSDLTRPEQVPKVGVEYLIFGQVVDDVEGNRQIRGEQASAVSEARAVVQEKALGRVAGEPALAHLDRGLGHIQADVAGIVGQRQLVTVTTAKLNDRSRAVLTDECVEEGGLSLGESTVRAHATGPPRT